MRSARTYAFHDVASRFAAFRLCQPPEPKVIGSSPIGRTNLQPSPFPHSTPAAHGRREPSRVTRPAVLRPASSVSIQRAPKDFHEPSPLKPRERPWVPRTTG